MRIAILLLLFTALLGCQVQFSAGSGKTEPASSGTAAEQKAIREVAATVVEQLDAEQWDAAWTASAASLKQSANLTAFTLGVRASRAMFGAPRTRAITGYAFPESVEGAPPGRYGIVFYATDLSKVSAVEEQVVLVQQGQEWRLAGYWAEKRKQVKVL